MRYSPHDPLGPFNINSCNNIYAAFRHTIQTTILSYRHTVAKPILMLYSYLEDCNNVQQVISQKVYIFSMGDVFGFCKQKYRYLIEWIDLWGFSWLFVSIAGEIICILCSGYQGCDKQLSEFEELRRAPSLKRPPINLWWFNYYINWMN